MYRLIESIMVVMHPLVRPPVRIPTWNPSAFIPRFTLSHHTSVLRSFKGVISIAIVDTELAASWSYFRGFTLRVKISILILWTHNSRRILLQEKIVDKLGNKDSNVLEYNRQRPLKGHARLL